MITEIAYFVAALLFIFGIKKLTKVKTAKTGNFLSSLGMFIAVLTTLVNMHFSGTIGWEMILAGVLVGSIIGLLLALKVQMTAMPQLVALFNGFGGGASVFVALASVFIQLSSSRFDMASIALSILIGSVTLTGSIVAFCKLQGILPSRPLLFKGNNILNGALFMLVLVLSFGIVVQEMNSPYAEIVLIGILIVAGTLGVLLTLPIGGADMPVVIALLNSYSGLAAASAGFVLKNIVLIVSGSLVGASGLILTQIMCKAMNRSLYNVMFGGFGQEVSKNEQTEYKNIKESSPDEAALLLENASSVIFVPGYGLAVAQAQHAIQELSEELEKKGIKTSFAIHPVAGRMPGHMNVLLAEADVPYDKLYDLESINDSFKSTDVVIVAGANDVVNPAATKDKSSPLYGMPILKAHEAGTVLVLKRSLSPGFAGVNNDLFDADNCRMIFTDAKKGILEIVKEFKEL